MFSKSQNSPFLLMMKESKKGRRQKGKKNCLLMFLVHDQSWKNKMETKMNDFEARMNKTSKRAEEGIKKWELYDYWNMRIACFFTVVYIFIFSWWGYRDWRDGKKRREDQQRFEEERQRREAEWKRL